MSTSELKHLIQQLSPDTREHFENAAVICGHYQHDKIEISHLLISLLDNHSSDVYRICEQLINPEKLKHDCQQHLSHIAKAPSSTPTFSFQLVELLKQAWMLSSLQHPGKQLRSSLLLLALKQDQDLMQIGESISSELEKLSADDIKQAIDSESNHQLTTTPGEKKSALAQYATSLTQLAKSGKIDAAIGRENEIRQLIDILNRKKQNNPLLLGEPGVGKTAIVEGLALRIAEQDVPEKLKTVELYTLDLAALQAGSAVRGEFENRLKQVIQEVQSAQHPIILFIDEAHTLIGAGNQSGQNDAANILKPALARGELRTIAATTWDEYKQFFEPDAALARRFQTVKVEEPDIKTATDMLRHISSNLFKHHQVDILDEAISDAVILSEKYINDRQLPDKAISLLDTACARLATKLNTTPARIVDLIQSLNNANAQLSILSKENMLYGTHKKIIASLKKNINETAAKLKTLKAKAKKEKAMILDIQTLKSSILEKASPAKQKKLASLKNKLHQLQANQALYQYELNGELIAEIITEWTGIPAERLKKDEQSKLASLDKDLKQSVIGQDHAVNTIVKSVKASSLQLNDPEKPRGVFLLTGPSGTGKTETALTLAETIYGSKSHLMTINMSEFKEAHKVALLAGAPPGYVGYGKGGVLTEAVRRQPYSLILLDEFEKAHPSVQDLFYQVFDKGVMRDSQGRNISFKNTIIIMTSNAASHEIKKLQGQDNSDIESAIHPILLQHFKPAFLGRCSIVAYNSLSNKALAKIVKLKLQKIEKRLKQHHKLELQYSKKTLENITELCQHDEFGARQVDEVFKQQLMPALSDIILKRLSDKMVPRKLRLSIKENRIQLDADT